MKPVQKSTQNEQPTSWDDLRKKAESTGFKKREDENGFSKETTNFYVSADDGKAEIVLLDPGTFPLTVRVHNVKMKSKNGKEYYHTETCQKSEQDHCTLCDAKKAGNGAISDAYDVFAFTVLDLRGKRAEDGKFDGEPTPLIWMATKKMLMQLIELKEQYEDLSGLVLEVKRLNKDTYVTVKMEKDPKNPRVQRMVQWEEELPVALPNRDFLWEAQSDKDLAWLLK